MADLKKWFAKKYESRVEEVNSILNQIKQVESNVDNIEQFGGGPGRGFYQFEKTAKDKETGEYIQSGAMTARNRLVNLYRKLGVIGKNEDPPKWLTQDGMNDPRIGFDAMKLTEEQQDSLVIADLYYKKVRGKSGYGNKLIKEALESNDARNLWVHAHWAGPEEDVDKKLEQFQRNVRITPVIPTSIAGDKLVEESIINQDRKGNITEI